MTPSVLISPDNHAVYWAVSNYFGYLNYWIVHDLFCSNNFSAKNNEAAEERRQLPNACLPLPPASRVALNESVCSPLFIFLSASTREGSIYLVAYDLG